MDVGTCSMYNGQRSLDVSFRLFIKDSFACRVNCSSPSLAGYLQFCSTVNLRWKCAEKDAANRYFQYISSLSPGSETYCHGLYYNLYELKALGCTAGLERLRRCLTQQVAVVKVNRGVLLLMKDNGITQQLGILPVNSPDGYTFHGVVLSKYSRQSRDMKTGIDNAHKIAKSEDHDPFVGHFLAWPRDTSLLSRQRMIDVFTKDHDHLLPTNIKTSCARTDHQYIVNKLVKVDKSVEVKHPGKGGKSERSENEVEEMILPERKRHKSQVDAEAKSTDECKEKDHDKLEETVSVNPSERRTLSSSQKTEKMKSEHKKTKHVDKPKNRSKPSKSGQSSSLLNKQQKSDEVITSLFSGLTKKIGRIPKKSSSSSSTSSKKKLPENLSENPRKLSKSPPKSSTVTSKQDSDIKLHKSHKSDLNEKSSTCSSTSKDENKKAKKSKHHKIKSKTEKEGTTAESISERENDSEFFDTVGKSWGIKELVRETLSEKTLTGLKSGRVSDKEKVGKTAEATIPGLGDLEEISKLMDYKEIASSVEKRSVKVTEDDLKVTVFGINNTTLYTEKNPDLQSIVNTALFGSHILIPMTEAKLQLWKCVLSIHSTSPRWQFSVTKPWVFEKKKSLYTVSLVGPNNREDNGEVTNASEKDIKADSRTVFDDVTNKLLSIVQGEKSTEWTYPESTISCHGSGEKKLVIPELTTADLSSEDELADIGRNPADVNTASRELSPTKATDIQSRLALIAGMHGDDLKEKDVAGEKNSKSKGSSSQDKSIFNPNGESQSNDRSRTSQTKDKSRWSQSRDRSRRSQSKDRSRRSQTKDRSRRSRSKDKDRNRRSQSKDRSKQIQSKDISRRSQSKDRSKQSQSKDRSKQSQSMERSRRSQSTDRNMQSQSKDRSRQSQSQSKDRSKESQSKDRSKRSPSKDRSRQSQSQSKDRSRESQSKDRSQQSPSKDRSRQSQSQSKDRSRRSQSNDRSKRSPSKDRSRQSQSQSKDRSRESQSKDRSQQSPSKDRSRQSQSQSKDRSRRSQSKDRSQQSPSKDRSRQSQSQSKDRSRRSQSNDRSKLSESKDRSRKDNLKDKNRQSISKDSIKQDQSKDKNEQNQTRESSQSRQESERSDKENTKQSKSGSKSKANESEERCQLLETKTKTSENSDDKQKAQISHKGEDINPNLKEQKIKERSWRNSKERERPRLDKATASGEPDKISERTVKRHGRQFHPYKKDDMARRKHVPRWSFDLAYSDMNELLLNMTMNSFRRQNLRPAAVQGRNNRMGRRSYGMKGRFYQFRFQRSEVWQTPPREQIYSSEEDEDIAVHPGEIPDLTERAKQADALEGFMGDGTEEEEYSTEKLIYETESKDDQTCNDAVASSTTKSLAIPGGPKTSTFAGEQLHEASEESDELAFTGNVRTTENIDQDTSQPTPCELKASISHQKSSCKSGITVSEQKNDIDKNDEPEKKNEGRVSVQRTDNELVKERVITSKINKETIDDHQGGMEREKVFVSISISNDEVSEGGNKEDKDRQPKEVRNKLILSSHSEECLDWEDEDSALDGKEDEIQHSEDEVSDSDCVFTVVDECTQTPEKCEYNEQEDTLKEHFDTVTPGGGKDVKIDKFRDERFKENTKRVVIDLKISKSVASDANDSVVAKDLVDAKDSVVAKDLVDKGEKVEEVVENDAKILDVRSEGLAIRCCEAVENDSQISEEVSEDLPIKTCETVENDAEKSKNKCEDLKVQTCKTIGYKANITEVKSEKWPIRIYDTVKKDEEEVIEKSEESIVKACETIVHVAKISAEKCEESTVKICKKSEEKSVELPIKMENDHKLLVEKALELIGETYNTISVEKTEDLTTSTNILVDVNNSEGIGLHEELTDKTCKTFVNNANNLEMKNENSSVENDVIFHVASQDELKVKSEIEMIDENDFNIAIKSDKKSTVRKEAQLTGETDYEIATKKTYKTDQSLTVNDDFKKSVEIDNEAEVENNIKTSIENSDELIFESNATKHSGTSAGGDTKILSESDELSTVENVTETSDGLSLKFSIKSCTTTDHMPINDPLVVKESTVAETNNLSASMKLIIDSYTPTVKMSKTDNESSSTENSLLGNDENEDDHVEERRVDGHLPEEEVKGYSSEKVAVKQDSDMSKDMVCVDSTAPQLNGDAMDEAFCGKDKFIYTDDTVITGKYEKIISKIAQEMKADDCEIKERFIAQCEAKRNYAEAYDSSVSDTEGVPELEDTSMMNLDRIFFG